jgi:hypothetical protein
VCRPAIRQRDAGELESLTVQLDRFACETLADESSRMGVSREELAVFSILYYLADLDSGRIARSMPSGEPTGRPA